MAEFGRESVKDFSNAQQAEEKFNFAISKFPKLADVSVASLKGLAQAISEKTKFSRLDVLATEAQLGQFNLTGKQVQQLTPIIADFAARTGRDLPEAATLVGRAFLGNTRALKTVGIQLDLTKTKSFDMAAAQKKLADAQQNLTFLEERQAAKTKLTVADRQALIKAQQKVAAAQDLVNSGLKAGAKPASTFDKIFGALKDKVGGFANKEGKTAAGQAKILAHQFEEVKIQVGAALTPVLLGLLKAIKPLLPVFGKLVTSLAKAIAPVIGVLAKALDDLLPAIVPIVEILGGAFLGVVKALLPALVPVVKAVAAALVPSLKLLAPFLEQIAQLFGQVLLALVPILPPLLALLPPLIKLALTIAGPLLQALTAILPPLVSLIVAGLTPLLNITAKVVDFLSRLLLPVFRTVRDFLVVSFHGAIALITRTFSALFDAAFKVAAFVGRLPREVGGAIGAVVRFFEGLPGKIAHAIAGLARTLFSAGKGMIQGLINGLLSSAERVGRFLVRIAKQGLHDFLHFFGIGSPSRLMFEHGQNIVEGLVQGIRASVPRFQSAMLQLSTTPGFTTPTLATVGTGGVGRGAVVQNIYSSQPDARVLANEIAWRLGREGER